MALVRLWGVGFWRVGGGGMVMGFFFAAAAGVCAGTGVWGPRWKLRAGVWVFGWCTRTRGTATGLHEAQRERSCGEGGSCAALVCGCMRLLEGGGCSRVVHAPVCAVRPVPTLTPGLSCGSLGGRELPCGVGHVRHFRCEPNFVQRHRGADEVRIGVRAPPHPTPHPSPPICPGPSSPCPHSVPALAGCHRCWCSVL
jgi:hypothetical protein